MVKKIDNLSNKINEIYDMLKLIIDDNKFEKKKKKNIKKSINEISQDKLNKLKTMVPNKFFKTNRFPEIMSELFEKYPNKIKNKNGEIIKRKNVKKKEYSTLIFNKTTLMQKKEWIEKYCGIINHETKKLEKLPKDLKYYSMCKFNEKKYLEIIDKNFNKELKYNFNSTPFNKKYRQFVIKEFSNLEKDERLYYDNLVIEEFENIKNDKYKSDDNKSSKSNYSSDDELSCSDSDSD